MPNDVTTSQLAARLAAPRARAAAAQAEVVRRNAEVAKAHANVAAARITGTPEVAALLADLRRSQAEAEIARRDHSQAVGAVHRDIADIIGRLDLADDFTALDAGVPLALLPVRLETRFAGDELLIRVFPDNLHVEQHEPELTEAEVAAGRDFWVRVWRGGTATDDAERAAWEAIAGSLGPNRASWVIRECTPNGGTRPTEPVPAERPLPDPPVFGEPARRGTASRRAVASCLPDRFVALAYRGGAEIGRASGKPLPDELPLGPDPSAPPPAAQDDPDRPPLGAELSWLTDFGPAEEIGMALRLALPPGTKQIDRLFVLGVSASLDPETSAGRLTALLDGHRYGPDGAAFLPQGTPTNNAELVRTGWSARRDPAQAYHVERRQPDPADLPAGANAAVTSAALGVPADVLCGLAGAAAPDQARVRAMHAVLWEATFGYWFERLLAPETENAFVTATRRFFLDRVRGRGPLPVLRVGDQPYGILSSTSLDRWAPGNESELTRTLMRFLLSLRRYWRAGLANVPAVRPDTDPDDAALGALSRDGVSRRVRVRSAIGENACRTHLNLFGEETDCARQRELSEIVLTSLGLQSAAPYIAMFVNGADAPDLRLPFVSAASGAEADAEARAAIDRLLDGRYQAILDEAGSAESATSLFYLLARQSGLAERVKVGLEIEKGSVTATAIPHRFDAEIFALNEDIIAQSLVSVSPNVALSPKAAVSSVMDVRIDGTPISELVHERVVVADVTQLRPEFVWYGEYANGLRALRETPADELALLLGETLDCCSHRLDAWLTGFASSRLAELRRTRPSGLHLGAYGFVADLTRRDPRTPAFVDVAVPEGLPEDAVVDEANAGYLHAPSLQHATTAAVLRSADLSHDGEAFAIDLRSHRVRRALALLDGVRNGQPLGALLGYQLERQLHEGFPGLELDEVIDQLRRLAPPPAVTAPPDDPEAQPVRAVADGLTLQRMGVDAVLPQIRLTGGEQTERFEAVRQALIDLDDAVDAVSDLLVAESVHQLTAGDAERAGATLDALNRGTAALPEPEVVRTPRSGTPLTQRLAVVLPQYLDRRAGWTTGQPRDLAAPTLEAWAGQLLGDPAAVTVVARYEPAEGAPVLQTSTLDAFGLCALDVVYDCGGSDTTSPLKQRLLYRLRQDPPDPALVDAPVRIEPAAAAPGALPLAATLRVARAIRRVLAISRPLNGADLARPQDAAAPTVDTAEVRARAVAASTSLRARASAITTSITAGDPAGVDEAVSRLAEYGLPADAMSGDLAAAERAAAGAVSRADRADAALARPEDGLGGPALAALNEVFGPDFRATVVVGASAAAGLGTALRSSGDLVRDAPAAGSAWLRRVGRVRAGAGQLNDLLLATDALGHGGPLALRVTQLPLDAFEPPGPQTRRWVGLPFTAPLTNIPVTSVVAHTVPDLAADATVCGLVVDEWTEVIPAKTVTTGVAFHADAPGARPPQSILLAVPPVAGQPWDLDGVVAVVTETLELAKLRMVDLDDVAWAGRFLPACYVPEGSVPGVHTVGIKQIVKAHANRFRENE